MQNEGLFIGLDTVMMTMCTGLQTFIHPGIFFPAIRGVNYRERNGKTGKGEMFGMDGLDTPPEYKGPSAGARV
jgi:hypothetical protein